MKTRRIHKITKQGLAVVFALATVLALSLLGLCFGHDIRQPPSWQPAQIWSQVDYDPKLTDPFFEAGQFSCPDGCTDCTPCWDDEPLVMHTAKCFSTSFGGEHRVRFCKAKLDDVNKIQLIIYENSPAYTEKLSIQIDDGMFKCQYKAEYPGTTRPYSYTIWTTKQQKLTLDREVYRKGDVIKGRIEFECLEEPTHPKYIEKWGRHLTTIKVYGVFMTVLQ